MSVYDNLGDLYRAVREAEEKQEETENDSEETADNE